MAHFAQVIEGIVVNVVVAESDFIATGALGDPRTWVQASYNTRGGIHFKPNSQEPSEDQSKALRKNFPSIGFSYDAVRDAFIPPREFDSWLLDEFSCLWGAPVPYPDDGIFYIWDEERLQWVDPLDEEPK